MRINEEIAKRELYLVKELVKHEARVNFQKFTSYTFENYQMEWFHKCICYYLDQLYSGGIKKLMIFVPPQHGKSELSSRRFPAYLLGRDPNLKLALCSYSADLSSSFNRAVQMIIDDDRYRDLYPNTMLNGKRVSTDTGNGVLRNSTMFEIVGHKGFLKTVGVGGSLTGTPVDIGIIDDPFKDRAEANSATYRNNKWDWYQDVFCTRLHNDSKQLMLFTRWHEDDMAGRLLDPSNPHYDEKEAKEWTVIALPALKEETPPIDCAIRINDPREIGEALWESRHSREKYEKRKRTNPTGFASLDQQRPSPLGGNMIQGEWFDIKKESELLFDIDSVTWHSFIDGAWTENKKNDETAISFVYHDTANNCIYIRAIISFRKRISEAIDKYKSVALQYGINQSSYTFIEAKASGKAFVDFLNNDGFNCVEIDNEIVKKGKYTRVQESEPKLLTKKVILIEGGWIRSFIQQCEAFPNAKHDDKVDVLTYPIHHFLLNEQNIYIT